MGDRGRVDDRGDGQNVARRPCKCTVHLLVHDDVVWVEAAFQWVFTRSGTRVNRVSDSKQIESGLE